MPKRKIILLLTNDYNQKELSRFFNERAKSYAKNSFVEYLFSEREKSASDEDDLRGLSVLDVGCGTGRLYDHLSMRFGNSFSYLGIDPAAEMLNASNIPNHKRKIGDSTILTPTDGPFDRIYLLGVSTYLPDTTLLPLLEQLSGLLSAEGKLVIHFTNALSLETIIRQWLRPIFQRGMNQRYVVSGKFAIYPRSKSYVKKILPNLYPEKMWKLPATIPFLQYFSPRLAIQCSRILGVWAPDFLRMDFGVTFTRSA